MTAFAKIGLSNPLLKAIEELGFDIPTPIQSKTIPHLLSSDRDLIALAQTGTGKTAAFGLPAIQLTVLSQKHPQTLVLCPTRELCIQVMKDLDIYGKYVDGLEVLAVYGGASIEKQIKSLRKGVHIVVGTPGRTKDLIKRKVLKLGEVERVILDEADEMLNMGFKEDLDDILSNTSDEKQTLLFSATMSKEVERITKQYLNDPDKISAARQNLGASTVKHLFYKVQAKDRYEALKRIADINPNIYGIVFCRTRRDTKDIANKLMQDGYNADAIHGDLSQAQRDEVMNRFRKRHLQMLVATDVAARGLDVNDLTHVINFNLPDNPEVYTHRSGRTGRAGKSGISIAIIHSRDMRKIKDIEKRSGISFKKELVPTGKDICSKQLYKLIDKIENVEVDEDQIGPFLPTINKKLSWLSREQLIKRFVSAEFNRFLEYYKGSRDLNLTDKKKDRGKQEQKTKRERRSQGFSTLYINLGYKNDLTPHRLIGLINEVLDSSEAEIGKIEITKKYSFFEIDTLVAPQLLEGLKRTKFEGVSVFAELTEGMPNYLFKEKRNPNKRKKGKSFGKKRNFRDKNPRTGRRKRR